MAVVTIPMAQPITIRLKTNGISHKPIWNKLKEYSAQARETVTAAAIKNLTRDKSMVEAKNSCGERGLAKRLSKLRDHTSSRNERHTACWQRNKISHKIIAPSKKAPQWL